MTIPQNKTELLTAININYQRLKTELESIPSNLIDEASMIGHAKDTLMSPNDLVAYLVGWGELVLKWDYKTKQNESIDWPETGFKWNELGSLAQKFYNDYENINYKARLKKLDKTVYAILALIELDNNQTLYEQLWYKKWTKGRMIQLNTASPYKNAYTRLRRWKKEQSIKL